MKNLFDNPKLQKPNRRNPTIPKPVEKLQHVRIPDSLHSRLKIVAIQQGKTIQEIAAEAIETYLNNVERQEKKDKDVE